MDTRAVAMVTELVLIILQSLITPCDCNHDAKRLFDDLLRKSKYNKLIRPVGNSTDKLTVKLGLKFTQLIDVDEKNEIMTTNMWVRQEWEDYSLRWEPDEYGGVNMIFVPSQDIWLPDIVLYNNADGDYTVSIMTKATLMSYGTVIWEPPAIYKSQCDINVRYFPFDEQLCKLKFGTWTYDGFQVDIQHLWLEKYGLEDTAYMEHGVDITEFYESVEWDLMRVAAKKTIKKYPCCAEPYPDITFHITLRRKTLFYAVNLIIPCVSINMLTCLTFFLPCDSGEKISLCISILLSLSLFQLLLMDLVPASSLNIPLVAKYIIFTNAIVAFSVFISVVTLSVNYRSASTHKMPALARVLFMRILPRLLFMQRPEKVNKPKTIDEEPHEEEFFRGSYNDLASVGDTYPQSLHPAEPILDEAFSHFSVSSNFIGANSFGSVDLSSFCDACAQRGSSLYPPHVQKALGGVAFIAKHLKDEDDSGRNKDEWKYVALVIDRLFLWIYISVCSVGAMGMLLSAPSLYDNTEPLELPRNQIGRIG